MLTRIKGGKETNSYVNIPEADVIITTLGIDSATEWNALTADEKEVRLIMAAQLMNYLPFAGDRMYVMQALAFPRTCQYDKRSIPVEIKEAQVLIAYSVVHRSLANRPGITEEMGMPVKSLSLGGLISITFGDKFASGGGFFDFLRSSIHFPIMAKLSRYISVIRGGVVRNTTDTDYPTYSTTTSYTTTSTSTSSSSSTTTTS